MGLPAGLAAGGGQRRQQFAHRLAAVDADSIADGLVGAAGTMALAGVFRAGRAGLWPCRAHHALAAGVGNGPAQWRPVRPAGRGAGLLQPQGAVGQRASLDCPKALAGLGLGRAGLRAFHDLVRRAALLRHPGQRAQPAAASGGGTGRAGRRGDFGRPGLAGVARPALARSDPVRQMAWGVLAVIGLHSLLEYPLWYGPFQLAAGLSVALLWRGAGRPDSGDFQQKFKSKMPLALYLRTVLAIIMIAILASVAISYDRVSQIYLSPEKRSAAYRDDTLRKIRDSLFFHRQALFAELSMTALTPANAPAMHAMALELLHYSPEPRVIEKLIESAVMLGRDDEALQYLVRYRAAFPKDHAHWAQAGKVAG